MITARDLNGCNLFWGLTLDNIRGREIIESADEVRLIIINDGEAIDLIPASPDLAAKSELTIEHECLSDRHYGLGLDLGRTKILNKDFFKPRFKLEKADWNDFNRALEENMLDVKMLQGMTRVDVDPLAEKKRYLV